MEIDPREAHLKYEPAPARPHDFDRRLKTIVDRCPTGELYLRFSWGMDVTEVLDGYILHRYPDTEGKFVGFDRWILEGWQASDVYDRQQWKENEDLLGPFPENGVWDFIAVVQDEKKRYLPLGEHALQMARDWRHWRTKDRPRLLEDLTAQRTKSAFLKEQRWEERKAEILGEFEKRFSDAERGNDTRKRTEIGKITGGKYKESPSGILIPELV